MNLLSGWRTYAAILAFVAAGLCTALGWIDAKLGAEVMFAAGAAAQWFQRMATARVEQKLDQ